MSESTYGEIIRAARKAKGWDRLALARESGVNVKTIFSIEINKSKARLETKLKIENHLGLSITSPDAPNRISADGPYLWAQEWVEEFRRVRKASGVSAAEIAKQTGTTVGHLYAIEKGRRLPRLDVAMALSDAVGMGIEW
jgi:transcriptional regulator with XRE-family HTH domain